MEFDEFCCKCLQNKELLREFNRLTGCKLGEYRTGLSRIIDDACGYDPDTETIPKFVEFVLECIWIPAMNREEY